jgi:hypothetical protein
MERNSQLIIQSEPINENNSFLDISYPQNKSFEEHNKKNSIFDNLDNNNFDFILNDFLQITDSQMINSDSSSLNKLNPTNSHSENSAKNKKEKKGFIPKDKKRKKNIEQKLLKNKISARKSRQKKKDYIKYLEEELVKLKSEISFNKNIKSDLNGEKDEINNKFFNKIIVFEKQKENIYKEGQKKQPNLMRETEASQKIILKELLIRQINYSIPLKFQIFGKKYIKLTYFLILAKVKLIPLSDDDSITTIISKINENLNKIKKYMENISKIRIKLVIKLYEMYKNIKCYIEYFNQLYSENFNY